MWIYYVKHPKQQRDRASDWALMCMQSMQLCMRLVLEGLFTSVKLCPAVILSEAPAALVTALFDCYKGTV